MEKISRLRYTGVKRSCFTLIELLVVIAIIAILAAILLPALNSARERGRSAACTNNAKQIAQAMLMYLDTSDDYFPYADPGDGYQPPTTKCSGYFWNALLYHAGLLDVDTSGTILRCQTLFGRFLIKPGANYQGPFAHDNFSFGNKQTYALAGTLGADKRVVKNHSAYSTPAKMSEISGGSTQVMLSEFALNDGGSTFNGEASFIYVGDQNPENSHYFFQKRTFTLHGSGFNVAFIDGHVDNREPATLWDTKYFKYRD